ncbi:hypothetical protein GGS23DRAFT_22373 [Durotheca rogersii]|uniref:uncharacterized protein n=1 Tax=Durotheca rogersii TaxID=419775 RepID=UPI00221EA564|nr:uncharacterized protein GGS23DRAFT_22373 [Durotheca rogersii]KAI5868325.1 hypothetical protein GGS23DRAFT_22373 [Durotheca rogersii]
MWPGYGGGLDKTSGSGRIALLLTLSNLFFFFSLSLSFSFFFFAFSFLYLSLLVISLSRHLISSPPALAWALWSPFAIVMAAALFFSPSPKSFSCASRINTSPEQSQQPGKITNQRRQGRKGRGEDP